MDRITYPLGPGTDGRAVGDLQDGLRLLVERRVLPLSDAERDTFLSRLVDERAATAYGDTTQKLVAHFQQRRSLPTTGEVDEGTAAALNDALERLEAFGRPARPVSFLVAGQVTEAGGTPVAAAAVRAEHVDGRLVVRLGVGNGHADETDHGGHVLRQVANLQVAHDRHVTRFENLQRRRIVRCPSEGPVGADPTWLKLVRALAFSSHTRCRLRCRSRLPVAAGAWMSRTA
jgi:peptidoglycan hydrolase-like protein with peptidoglycan-binding domain